jgi:muramoyltetrapeptide carboxypeptidase
LEVLGISLLRSAFVQKRIKVVAPARWIEPELAVRFAALAERYGFAVEVSDQCFERTGQLAGPDERRAAVLAEALADPAVDIVWCARGGYGAGRLLDGLCAAGLDGGGKALVGYSDITTLLLGLRVPGLTLVHGPMPIDLDGPGREENLARLLADFAAGRLPTPPAPDGAGLRVIRPGAARGPLVAANLSLLTRLLGTRHCPDLDGTILVVEDVDEYLYAIDRMFLHLHHADVLNRIAGLAVGEFSGAQDNETPFGDDLEAIVRRFAGCLDKPVVIGYPMGHGRLNFAMPEGVEAELKAGEDGVSLTWPTGA